MRSRRLQTDWEKMRQLQYASDLISFDICGQSVDRYIVNFRCKGLIWLPDAKAPSISANHRCEMYLHMNYPRNPPQLRWLTDIFHPNILPPGQNGGVCIGYWTPAESLDQLCVRIAEMIQMKNFNATDPLNPVAAEWVKQNIDKFPIDNRPVLKPEPEILL